VRIRLLLAWLIAAMVATGVGIALDEGPSTWPDPVAQWSEIRFSHRFHLEEVEAECGDCHEGAASSSSSADFLLPGHEECGACHELDCATCHAGVETSEAPSTAFLPGMEICSTCHLDVAAPRACEACHERLDNLVPVSHQRLGWNLEHQALIRTGGWSNDCASCHSENDCQACHVNPTLQLTRDAPQRVVSEFRPAPDGRRSLILKDVHELNYRFTHPADARSKKTDCYVCHDQQNFCVECHQREQDAGFGPPVPLGHGDTGFVRVGVGSGGGTHADLARRDIESCAACHDVLGRDPLCVACHVDRSPGLGNDPRTHSSRFNDRNGDWHSNGGSVCYNCHTNTGQAGVGFCGYCHGVGG